MSLSRRRAENVRGGRAERGCRVRWRDAEQEARVREIAAARGGVSIPRLLVESTLELAAGEVVSDFDRREVLTELQALRRLLAGVANNVNQLTRIAHVTGAMPVAQLEAEFEWLHRMAGPDGRLAGVLEGFAVPARRGKRSA